MEEQRIFVLWEKTPSMARVSYTVRRREGKLAMKVVASVYVEPTNNQELVVGSDLLTNVLDSRIQSPISIHDPKAARGVAISILV